jgi:O-antigen ligase
MNKISDQTIDARVVFLFLVISALTLAAGFLFTQASTLMAVGITIGVIIAVIGFVNTELALYLLIIAMLLGPQFTAGPAETFTARGRGGMTLRFDDFLLVVIGLSWFLRTAINKELGLFPATPLTRPIFWYFIVCLIATLFGYYFERVRSLTGIFFVLKYFEYFLIYFMAVQHLKERKQIERFLFTLLMVCFIVCLISIYQIPTGARVSAPFEGPEGEPNTLGGYLVLMLSITLGLLLNYGTRTKKALLGILVFLILITLGATLSRSSWMALIPMILTLIYFSRKRMQILIPVLIVIVISPLFLPKAVVDRALYTIRQAPEQGQFNIAGTRIDTSTSARLESYQLVLTRDFIKQPLIGYGVTGYSFVDAQYIKVLADTGILGLMAFAYLLYVTYKNARESYRKTNDPMFSGLTLGYLAGFMAMLVHAIGANTFIIVRIMEPFWFLTAMIIIIPTVEANERQEQQQTDNVARKLL